MNSFQSKIYTSSLFIIIACSQSHAFSNTSTRFASNDAISVGESDGYWHKSKFGGGILKQNTKILCTSSRLLYRAHEAKDDEESFSRFRRRAGPTFRKPETTLKGKSCPTVKRGINGALFISLIINQLFILTSAAGLGAIYLLFSGNQQFLTDGVLNWTGSIHSPSASLDFSLTTIRLIQGALSAIPTIALSTYLERSDDRQFVKTNFSTIFMVMTLFGRRKIPEKEGNKPFRNVALIVNTLDVALLSATISILTGFCEEIAFRGVIPHIWMSTLFFQDPTLACVGQAGLFALGHTSPKTSMKENKVVGSIQFLYAIWMGSLYHLTGGDIVPCMVSHAIYDFQILFISWLTANEQIEYSESKSMDPVPIDSLVEVEIMKRELGKILSSEKFNIIKRVFYIFDEDKNGFISRSEAQRGVSYLEAEGLIIAPSVKTIDSVFDTCIKMRASKGHDLYIGIPRQLRLADFLRLFLTIKAGSDSYVATVSANLYPEEVEFE